MSEAPAAAAKRIKLAVNHLQEAGVEDCLIVFEGLDRDNRVRPYVIRIGSPSACLEFAQFAAEYLENERDCTVYGMDDEELGEYED
jgi:hypothetical protein